MQRSTDFLTKTKSNMKKEKFKLGDKVRVVNPSRYSDNKVGDIGYVVAIEDGELADVGKCIVYQIHQDVNFAGANPTWEGESCIVLASEPTYCELLKQRDELLKACIMAFDNLKKGESKTKYRLITCLNALAEAINNSTLTNQ